MEEAQRTLLMFNEEARQEHETLMLSECKECFHTRDRVCAPHVQYACSDATLVRCIPTLAWYRGQHGRSQERFGQDPQYVSHPKVLGLWRRLRDQWGTERLLLGFRVSVFNPVQPFKAVNQYNMHAYAVVVCAATKRVLILDPFSKEASFLAGQTRYPSIHLRCLWDLLHGKHSMANKDFEAGIWLCFGTSTFDRLDCAHVTAEALKGMTGSRFDALVNAADKVTLEKPRSG